MNGSSFARIRSAMENIRTIRTETGRPERVTVDFVLMKRNLEDIHPAAVLTKEMGFDAVYYKNLWITYPEFEGESIYSNKECHDKAYEQISRVASNGYAIQCEPWPELTLLRRQTAANKARALRTQLSVPLSRARKGLRNGRKLFRDHLMRRPKNTEHVPAYVAKGGTLPCTYP